MASWHYAVDNNSVVQSVRESDIAWHAPGANHDGIGIEHAGRARQSRSEWLDAYGKAMLELSAKLCAEVCKRHAIPVRWLSVEQLLNNARGITSHNNVSKAFKRSSHWDPGSGFPVDHYLERTRFHLAAMTERVKFLLMDGEGTQLTNSIAVKAGGDEEEARLVTFQKNSLVATLKELRADGDVVIRRQRV